MSAPIGSKLSDDHDSDERDDHDGEDHDDRDGDDQILSHRDLKAAVQKYTAVHTT